MDFIAVLEYEQLDNGLFLTAFARSLARRKSRGIVLHGDSEYTERLIQTGMMREDARIRAIKDLNHRLIALFADQGISAIGLNGYQKSMIRVQNGELHINRNVIDTLPVHPMLLISNLAESTESGRPVPVSLPELSEKLQMLYSVCDITVFSIHEASEIVKNELPVKTSAQSLGDEFKTRHLPEGFRQSETSILLTTADAFGSS